MPEVIDLDNIVLTVADVVDDEIEGIGYVMEPVPNLHMHVSPLIDPDGREYHPDQVEGSGPVFDETGSFLFEYTFYFGKDHDPGFAVGEQLSRPPAPWRKKIPKANLIGIDYRASNVRLECDDLENLEVKMVQEQRFTIDCEGNTTVSIERSIFREPGVLADTNVGGGRTRELFQRFQRCLSECDCYEVFACDDTGRSMTLRFSDGSEAELEGVFAHGGQINNSYDNTAQAIDDFVINTLHVSKSVYF